MNGSGARAVGLEVTFFISQQIVDVMHISLSRDDFFLSGPVFYWGIIKSLYLI